VLWVASLVPAIIAATGWMGIVGAGWVHLAVAVVVVLPAYLVALHRNGISIAGLARCCWQPVAAVIPAAGIALAASALFPSPLVDLAVGALVGGGAYVLLMYRWVTRRIRALGSAEPAASAVPPTSAEKEGRP
jgi:lipopolysaccharide exporter